MADVLGYIDLFKSVIRAAKTIYDVSKKIVTNFQEQKEILMREVNFLRDRVKRLQTELGQGEERGDVMDGVRDVLGNIITLFGEIERFLKEVAEYKCSDLFEVITTFLSKYKEFQKKFADFTSELHRLRENLNDAIGDATLIRQERMNRNIQEIKEQICKAQENDLTKDIKHFKNILEGNQLHGRRKSKRLKSTLKTLERSANPIPRMPGPTMSFISLTKPLSGKELQEAKSTLNNFEREVKKELEQELKKCCQK